MESMGRRKKGVEKTARAALQAAVLAATVLSNPGETMAGKREATIRFFESKTSDTIKPEIVAEDTPKDEPKDPKVKWKIRE